MRITCILFGFVFWLGLSIFSYAEAGAHVVGNGGGVVMCRTGSLSTYETLDLYEARILRRLPILVDAEKSATEIALRQVELLFQFDSGFGHLLHKYIEEFHFEANIIANLAFAPTDDFGDIILQENCELQQAAIQVTPMYPNDKRYFIDEEIWNRLDSVSQSAIILHEVVYRVLLAEGQTNSQNARYVVGELLSHNCNTFLYSEHENCWSTQKYTEMAAAIGFVPFKDRPK